MAEESLAGALEREHHEIDTGIEAYTGTADLTSLVQAMAALRRHIYLEERFLFPPLREAGLFGPIMVMLREHGELWNNMDALARMLSGGQTGDEITGDETSGDETMATCRTMLDQLAAHNAKEEAIVYPQAETSLSPADIGQLREFLQSGQLPAGWVCERGSTR